MSLLAQATVPDAFDSWQAEPIKLGGLERTLIPSNGEWECLTGGGSKRATLDAPAAFYNDSLLEGTRPSTHALGRRGVPYGPVIKLPKADQLCPNKGGPATIAPCDKTWAADDMYEDSDDGNFFRRAVEAGSAPFDPESNNVTDSGVDGVHLHQLVARLSKEGLFICATHAKMLINFPDYDSNGAIYDNSAWNDCTNCTLSSPDSPSLIHPGSRR